MNRTDATNVQVAMATDSNVHTEVTIAPEVAAVLDGTSQYAVVCGDATAVMATIPSGIASVCYCDPPYGLSKQDTASIVECLTKWLAGQVYEHGEKGFMSTEWDGHVPGPEAWREVHRALKPGGYCVAFSSTRTVDILGMSIRLAGFELRNGMAWAFGCLSDDTELLTDKGWEPHQKITTSHVAMCYDLSDGTYKWQPVQEVFVYPHDDTAYRVHSNRTDQIVTRSHRCLVERGGELVFQIAEEASREREVRVPVLEDVQTLLSAVPVQVEERATAKTDVQQRVCDRICQCESHGSHEASRGEARDRPSVCRVWHGNGAAYVHRNAGFAGILLDQMSRDVANERSCHARSTQVNRQERQGGVDRCVVNFVQIEDDRRQKPCMEGRGYHLQDSRELRGSQVREVPHGVPADGAEGRVRDGAPPYRRWDDGKVLVSGGDCASRQSRSHGQQAGEPRTVRHEQGSQTVRASRFTATDLVRIEAIHYTGIVWCVRVPTGAFVARRNGKVFVTGNSGFPKSLNVSVAIEATELTGGSRPEDIRRTSMGDDYEPSGRGRVNYDHGSGSVMNGATERTAPATDDAKTWSGYGTDVKPAYEPLIVARKELQGTVAANVLAHGCGVLNIDAARITGTVQSGAGSYGFGAGREDGYAEGTGRQYQSAGRYPASIAFVHDEECELVGVTKVAATSIHGEDTATRRSAGAWDGAGGHQASGVKNRVTGYADPDGTETVDDWQCTPTCAVAELARQSGERPGCFSPSDAIGPTSILRPGQGAYQKQGPIYGDTGSAARFFYNAKASANDRLAYVTCSDGCEHHNSVTGVREAKTTARDARREPLGGFCCVTPNVHSHADVAMHARNFVGGMVPVGLPTGERSAATPEPTCVAIRDIVVAAIELASKAADALYDTGAEDESKAINATVAHWQSTIAKSAGAEVARCVGIVADDTSLHSRVKFVARNGFSDHGFCRKCGAPRKHYQHPTVKPLSLARHHAKLLSLPAHLAPIALVPFCGTGIEAAALLEAGFRVIAIDLDPRHCAMTEYRLANIGINADEPKRRVTGKPAAKVAPVKVAKPTAQLDLFGAK